LCAAPDVRERAWCSSIAVLESVVVLGAHAPLPFITTYTTYIQMSHATASRKEMCLFFLESLAAIVFDSLAAITQSCAASVFIYVNLVTCASIPRVAGSKGPAQTRGTGTDKREARGAQTVCPSRSTDSRRGTESVCESE